MDMSPRSMTNRTRRVSIDDTTQDEYGRWNQAFPVMIYMHGSGFLATNKAFTGTATGTGTTVDGMGWSLCSGHVRK